jgi:D-glycero-D-manno-heptose 1,7-bisphosphate phosphatase
LHKERKQQTVKFPPGPILDPATVGLLNYPKGVVVFDRDGTLVEDAGQHNDQARLVFREGAIDAIALAKGLGFGVAIASNQAGLETEKFSLDQLMAFNAELRSQVAVAGGIDVIVVCPHHESSQCECRKPKTGLFEAIEGSGVGSPIVFVGDTQSDQMAALASKIEYLDVAHSNIFEVVQDWSRSHEAS